MKKITNDLFKAIERQMYNRARDIDLAVFNSLFIDNDKEMVLQAISMYQNADGGFGHQLEIDNLNPYSTAVQTEEALKILKLVGYKSINEDEFLKEILNKAFKYLYDKSIRITNKWLLSEPSNDKFPCAKWYKYNEETKGLSNYNPTASIVGLTLYFCEPNMKFYKKALQLVDGIIKGFYMLENVNENDLNSFKVFIDCLKEKDLQFEGLNQLEEDIKNKALELNTSILEIFDGYTSNENIDELINNSLDSLIDELKPHGLWEVGYKWETEYPEEESAMLKHMGNITYKNLYLLKKFDRI